jgi:hypothetical protein
LWLNNLDRFLLHFLLLIYKHDFFDRFSLYRLTG